MYYKYRSITNLQFLLDIVINGRLYASDYTSLNDPMEGYFKYSKEILWPDDLRYIDKVIARHRVLSLSADPLDTLMWTHYADSHKGFIIGIELDKNIEVHPVRYTKKFEFDGNTGDIGIDILTKKAPCWRYEKEHRVFTEANKEHVPVSIREVAFGVKTNSDIKELISDLFKKYHPETEIGQIKERQLHTYSLKKKTPSKRINSVF